ncbi:hypothetical protein, partial [Neisseria gonorrhoeae]|uniref:hypothetical protein n=1 Tax=Neisseria gonorrhoeae TaxID=485 RepID=UPI001BC9B028
QEFIGNGRSLKVWIPAFAGMTIQKLHETQKKTKPNEPDSRFYGNDGISVSVRTNLDSRLRGNDGILDCGYLSGMAI